MSLRRIKRPVSRHASAHKPWMARSVLWENCRPGIAVLHIARSPQRLNTVYRYPIISSSSTSLRGAMPDRCTRLAPWSLVSTKEKLLDSRQGAPYIVDKMSPFINFIERIFCVQGLYDAPFVAC